jgi:hypothetical protein
VPALELATRAIESRHRHAYRYNQPAANVVAQAVRVPIGSFFFFFFVSGREENAHYVQCTSLMPEQLSEMVSQILAGMDVDEIPRLFEKLTHQPAVIFPAMPASPPPLTTLHCVMLFAKALMSKGTSLRWNGDMPAALLLSAEVSASDMFPGQGQRAFEMANNALEQEVRACC